MQWEGTPCCGLAIIEGLEQDKKELYQIMADAKDDNKGFILATINGNEKRAGYGKFLLATGFKLMREFHNPNSGKRVSMYGRSLARIKAREMGDTSYRH